ncbi:MAG: DNA-directed RNA polymerase subunit beta' [Patescibacteria group bacterium]
MYTEPTQGTASDFAAIRLKLASPEAVRRWSHGEVTKPETVNYRTQKPEKEGLFSERIFGPSKDWECYCGKYKKIRYKGIVCDKCGVEVTRAVVRRERMGHIELKAPVSHIWFLRGVPSKIGLMLDLSMQNLEKVIYFANFIITEVDEGLREATIEQVKQEYQAKRRSIEADYQHEVKDAQGDGTSEKRTAIAKVRDERLAELEEVFALAERELRDLKPMRIISESTYHDLSLKYGHVFTAGIGAEAVYKLLSEIDLPALRETMEEEMEEAGGARAEKLTRRMKLLKSFMQNHLRPEWMIITALPVIPPDLRPMVPLDGGRFATSDLNDLYRRVINRNNRLKQLVELNAPEVITRNEKRMLQEAVDALIDNSARHGKTVMAATGQKRSLKSLADMLKGKQGRFRQNLLGKRIDYSGRSVIVVGPTLKMHQCGLPKRMALELFRPFVISKLISRELVHNVRSANRYIESARPEVWDILDEIVADAFVLLNRAPTLHRLGIQAFRPILVEGKAIQLHPLVCPAFNADFDGDQMAVHVPLTTEARREAAELMLSSKNLLKPAHGEPVASPNQDIVWGLHYLTTVDEDEATANKRLFGSPTEAITAHDLKVVGLRQMLTVRLLSGEIVVTSVGRLLFNEVMPESVGFMNEVMDKRTLGNVVKKVIELEEVDRAAQLLDDLKDLGFAYLTKSGLSWSMGDIPSLPEKPEIIEAAHKEVDEVQQQYADGLLTNDERHSQVVQLWTSAKDKVVALSKNILPKGSSVYTMVESGARGSWGQLTQIVGMKGLVTNPSGDIIELPVTGNFKDGFDVLEYFISTHGARKGLSDTALRTANAGYLTRRLVDVAQDVIVQSTDCGDQEGLVITREEAASTGQTLEEKVAGRVVLERVMKPGTRKVIVKEGELIGSDVLAELIEAKVDSVRIASIMTCKMGRGVCVKCYGLDLGYNRPVSLGTAVGIIAAESIGEPGTQLTMRTFHTGGVAGQDITQGLPRVEELFEVRPPKRKTFLADVAGVVSITTPSREANPDAPRGQRLLRIVSNEPVPDADPEIGENIREIIIPPGYRLLVNDGATVTVGEQLTDGSNDLQQLFRLRGRLETQRYIIREIQYIYSSQGQKLNDKHVEVICRQLFSRVYVTNAGDSDLLPGEIVERAQVMDANAGSSKDLVEYDELLLGMTKAALSTKSFLAAASFQETARVLINAATSGRVDRLEGLKENVLIGRLIPAGTGFRDKHMAVAPAPALPAAE